MSIKVYNDKELEKLSKKNLISLVKEYQSLPQVTSIPTEDKIGSIKQDARHVRLYAKSYNNPFLGMEIKGGELYDRCECDFILTNFILEFRIKYNSPAGVLDGLKSSKHSSIVINKYHLYIIDLYGLEKFVREHFGFIDILPNKNESPFSNYTFVG